MGLLDLLFGGSGDKSSGSSSGGDGKQGDGDRWTSGDHTYTANSADDKKAQGGYYLSVHDNKTGQHSTAVYNKDGTLADVKVNKQLK